MCINLVNYRKSGEIIINLFRTWPNSLKHLIKNNYNTLKCYRETELFNEKLKKKYQRQKQYYKIHEINNPFYDRLQELKKEFLNLLMQENKPFICLHASRYTPNEIKEIKQNGLKLTTKENLYSRIDNLLIDKIISVEQCNFLKTHNLLGTGRENQIWFTHGDVDISLNSTELVNLYQNYGGEILYSSILGTALATQLNSHSLPCLVISKVKPSQIVWWELENLIDNIFCNINFTNASLISSEFYIEEQTIPVEDVVKINENSKLKN